VGPLRFELKSLAPQAMPYGEKQSIYVTEDVLKQYLDVLEINGICHDWKYSVDKCILQPYFHYVHWHVTFKDTLEYLKILKGKHKLSYYRKHVYQIRKFLEYLGIEWSNKLNPPPEPECIPKHMTQDTIEDALAYFEKHEYAKQAKAIILLGCTSGMRAEELYQLTIEDIDIQNRVVRINHNPDNGQSTKTKRSRVSFFTNEAKEALIDYLAFYDDKSNLKCLFNQWHIERIFRPSSYHVKDLRKYFSQEWDRRGGPTSIKKILMGHSLKGDVDLQHYNYQSEEDLKKIYDKVMCNSGDI
jgi:integrase/recombinase XerD